MGLYYFRRLSKPFRLFFLINVVALFVETIGHFISYTLQKPNLWLFNIYLFVDPILYLSLAGFFVREYLKKYLYLMCLGNLVVWAYLIYRNSIFNFAYFSLVLTALIITFIYTFILIDNTMRSSKGVAKDPLFWLCLSIVSYYACDIPFMSTLALEASAFIKTAAHMHTFDVNDVLGVVSQVFECLTIVMAAKEMKNYKLTNG